MRGKYLNAFGEYTERIYAYMEKTQRDSWPRDIKVCISQLIIIRIKKISMFFLSTLDGMD